AEARAPLPELQLSCPGRRPCAGRNQAPVAGPRRDPEPHAARTRPRGESPMKRLLLPLLLTASFGAHAIEYGNVLVDKSQIHFTSKQMGVPVDGRFGKFAATLSFDPAKPEAGKAHIEVDLASVDAGSKDANDEVVGKGWFNAKEYPKARFVSSSVKALGNNRFEAKGQMTIKG